MTISELIKQLELIEDKSITVLLDVSGDSLVQYKVTCALEQSKYCVITHCFEEV